MSAQPPIPPSKKQKDVLDFIHKFLIFKGYPPTRPEIAVGIKRPKQSCNEHFQALIRKGWLHADFGIPRGLRLLHTGDAPFFDGATPLADDQPLKTEERIIDRVPRTIVDAFTPRPDFFITTDGQQAAINVEAGDLLAVRAATDAEDGTLVMGRTSGQIVCRRLDRTLNDDGHPLRIEGVVVGSLNARALGNAPVDTPSSEPIPLSPRQQDVIDCIAESIRTRGYPPARGEIASAIGTRTEQGIQVHLRALVRKKYLVIDENKIRGFRLTRTGSVPIIDASRRARASEPLGHEKRIVDRAPATLADRFTPRPDYFVRVKDPHSAIEIATHDLVAVQAASSAEPETVVIGRIKDRVVCRRADTADTGEPGPLRVEGTVVGTLSAQTIKG